MANTVVGGASVEVTIDLSKFATDARTKLTQALSSSSMRDAITAGLNAAASDAGVAGQTAATKFASGVSGSASSLSAAGTKAGQAVTEGLTGGVDGSISVLRDAGAKGGSEFASAVGQAASGTDLAADATSAGAEATVAFAAAGEEAGAAFSDGVSTAIDAGSGDVANAADEQAGGVDAGASDALSEAGASAGDSFVDASKESVKQLSSTVTPIATAEAAKVGVEAGTHLSAAGKEAGAKFGEGITESFKGLASSLGPVVGVLGAGELVKSSLEAADQLEGANIKIENVFGESGDAVKKWAGGVADSLRESSLQAENEAGQFGAYLSGLGVGKTQAAGLSEQLVGLTANMAAFNNADPAEVQAALTSALRGRTTALKQYGVTLTTAQVNQEAMAHASELGNIAMSNGEPVLNTQQKALATLYAVMDATKNQQNALADTQDTVKAKGQEATAQFANMRAELGTALLPVLSEVFSFINTDAIPALEDTGHWISENSSWLGPLALALGGAAVAFKTVGLATKAWGLAAKETAALLQLLGLGAEEATVATEEETVAQTELDVAMDANPIGLIVAAIAALAIGLYEAYEHSKTFRDIVNEIGSVLETVWKNVLQPVIGWVIDHWRTLVLALPLIMGPLGIVILAVIELATHWHTVMDALETAWHAVWTALKAAWNTVGKPIFDIIKDAIHFWVEAVKVEFTALVVAGALIWDAWKFVWDTVGKPVFDLIADAISFWWNDMVKPVFDGITWVFQTLWTGLQVIWDNVGKPIFDGIETAARGVGDGLKWAYDNIVKPTGDLLEQVWNDIKAGWDRMLTGLGRIGDDVLGPIKDAINEVIGVINAMLRALDKIHVTLPKVNVPGIGSVGGETIGFDVPEIPNIAAGATILPRRGGTLINVAEAGKAETVVDTGQMNRLLGVVNSRLDGSHGIGGSVEIHEHIYQQPGQDPASLASDVSRRVVRQIRIAA